MFGPGALFTFAPERKYTPSDASAAQLFALRDRLGISCQVIVQATCHGADNSALLDALAQSNGRARGVATVRREVSDDQLERMHALGVRGVRFNFVRRLVDFTPKAGLRLLREHPNVWAKLSCPERLSLSGPPALDGEAQPYHDVLPFAQRVLEEFPERVLWGTDWPPPNLKDHMLDDGLLAVFVAQLAPTPERQQRLLVDNPMRLYWPDETTT